MPTTTATTRAAGLGLQGRAGGEMNAGAGTLTAGAGPGRRWGRAGAPPGPGWDAPGWDAALLCFALLCCAVLCFALLCFVLLCFACKTYA